MARYVYPWPAGLRVTGSVWQPVHRIGMTRSLLTGAVYQTETHRPRIAAQVNGVAGPAHAPELAIFLARMRGGHNLVRLHDWEGWRNGGVNSIYAPATIYWSGAPETHFWDDDAVARTWSVANIRLRADAAADDASIEVEGLWPSQPAFQRGAELSIGGWTYRVSAAVSADANGHATVPVAPRLVVATAAGTAVDHARSGLFVLTGPPRGLDRDIFGAARWSMDFLQVFEEELVEAPVYETA